MYITKLIQRNGLYEDLAKQIDSEANEMLAKGYELITYQLLPNTGQLIITFKKK